MDPFKAATQRAPPLARTMAAGGAIANREGCTACIANPATPAPMEMPCWIRTFPMAPSVKPASASFVRPVQLIASKTVTFR